MNLPTIYLASGSPRRSELLAQMGVSFDVLRLSVDETQLSDENPVDYVERVAVAKAKAGWQAIQSGIRRPVIGADTSVIIDQTILGKPQNEQQARNMLQSLSGRQHQVLTAVAAVYDDQVICRLNQSWVTFITLSPAEITWYLSTGEGQDKAGGYAVQGLAAMFIEEIQGSYSGIMGLPVRETRELLMEIGQFCYE